MSNNIALITFFENRDHIVRIANGFSFFHHKINGADIFINLTAPPVPVVLQKELSSYQQIYCSVSYLFQLEYILDSIDNRWILGGPFIEFYHEHLKFLPCTLISTPFEYHATPPSTLSNRFTDYWNQRLPPQPNCETISYNCSLGKGCYWNRCAFCTYATQTNNRESRSDIARILDQLEYNPHYTISIASLCFSATPLSALKIIMAKLPELRTKRILPHIYIRPDKAIVDYLCNDCPDVDGAIFLCGLEAFSDETLRILNKNASVETSIMLLSIARRGATVRLTYMENYPFMSKEILRKSQANLAEMLQIRAGLEHPQKIQFLSTGRTLWPTREIAQKMAAQYGGVVREANWGDEWHAEQNWGRQLLSRRIPLPATYVIDLPEGSQMAENNAILSREIPFTRI